MIRPNLKRPVPDRKNKEDTMKLKRGALTTCGFAAIMTAIALLAPTGAESSTPEQRQEETQTTIATTQEAETEAETIAREELTTEEEKQPQEEADEATEATTEEEKPQASVNEYERDLLARVITAEAGGSSYEMQYMVGVVILNRIAYGYWGDTMDAVIYAGGQYACTNKLPYIEPTETAQAIAEDLLANGHNEPADVIWQAEFIQGTAIYKKIDNMYFCR